MRDVLLVPAVLGWSNSDTGPENVRLYALDQGPSPRWVEPSARVVERSLVERLAVEGDRAVVLVVGDRFLPNDVFEQCQVAAVLAVAEVLAKAAFEQT
jgi:hypothetical protein